jgi:hypothetical protein
MSTTRFLGAESVIIAEAASRGSRLERNDWRFVANRAQEMLASEADLARAGQGVPPKLLNDKGLLGPIQDYVRGDTDFDGLMKTLGLRNGISPAQEARADRLKTDLQQRFPFIGDPVITPRTGRIDIGFHFREGPRSGTNSLFRSDGVYEHFDYDRGLGYASGWGPEQWVHGVPRTAKKIGIATLVAGPVILAGYGVREALDR